MFEESAFFMIFSLRHPKIFIKEFYRTAIKNI